MKRKMIVSLAIVSLLIGLAAKPIAAEQYRVKKGDNLWTIAQRYNTTVRDLKDWNSLSSNLIHPNQTLQIGRQQANQANSAEKQYIVKQGDTLSEIAQSYNISVLELKSWNGLSSDLILIGQRLTIKDSQSSVSRVSAAKSNSSNKKRQLTVTATAYTAECTGCTGITYTGINLNKNRHKKVIAVDPNVIPLGSKVYVEGYGEAIAGDIGSAIKGHKIDIHVPTKEIAYQWGVRTVDVTILN